MRVHNLTDVSTEGLKRNGLFRQMIAVGRALLAPGESQVVADEHMQHIRPGLQKLVAAGALAIGDQLPAGYVLEKLRAAKKSGG